MNYSFIFYSGWIDLAGLVFCNYTLDWGTKGFVQILVADKSHSIIHEFGNQRITAKDRIRIPAVSKIFKFITAVLFSNYSRIHYPPKRAHTPKGLIS